MDVIGFRYTGFVYVVVKAVVQVLDRTVVVTQNPVSENVSTANSVDRCWNFIMAPLRPK